MNAVDIPKMGRKITIDEDGYSAKVYLSPLNRRLRIIEYSGQRLDLLAEKLDILADKYDFAGKIFGKIKENDSYIFQGRGYEKEASIKGYFNGVDASIMAKYPNISRKATLPSVYEKELKVMEALDGIETDDLAPLLPAGYTFSAAATDLDFQDLASLYKTVFESYPFPIFDSEYLKSTAESHIMYGLIRNSKGKLVAAASAETDQKKNNAEMTDFATLPSERGMGLASVLLHELQKTAYLRGIRSFYTIARSRSLGMNKVFKKAGYNFTGKLTNNCQICGSFENMSVWCKKLK